MFRKFLDFFRDQVSNLKSEKGLIGASLDRSVGRFTMLDPKRVKEQFNITELATENGKDEIPDSAATPPDPLEEQISAHFKALEIEEGTIMSSRIEAYQRSMKSLSADLDMHALEMERSNILLEARESVNKSEVDLYSLEKNFKAADSQLKVFIKENNLHKTAPQNQGNRILKVGILSVLFLVESILNATFFASTQSYFGAYGYAVTLSIINLLLPFLMAWKVVCFKNSINEFDRYKGWIGFFAMVIILITVNLLGGHIREAMLDPTLIAAKAFDHSALEHFKNSPFIFNNIFTYYFALLGLIFASIAFYDGYTFDDPYPNFGSLWRNAEKITRKMQDHYANAVDDIGNLFNDFNNEFQAKLKSIDMRKQKFAEYSQGMRQLKAQFEAFQSQISSAYVSVVSEYRSINRQHRKTKAPNYFRSSPKYDFAFHLDNLPSKSFYDDIDFILKESHRELPKMIEKMAKEHKSLLAKIPKLNKIKEMN